MINPHQPFTDQRVIIPENPICFPSVNLKKERRNRALQNLIIPFPAPLHLRSFKHRKPFLCNNKFNINLLQP